MKKKLTIGLAIVATALAGTAFAAHHEGGHKMGDKAMTLAEAQTHAAQMFDRMDANKDGKIDAADRDARKAAMFTRIDANKDGSVSADEFAAGRKASGGEGAEGKRGHGGGHRMGGMHRIGGMGGGMMGKMADGNKDGAITRDEFVAATVSHFDLADADKNDTVTPEERKAAHAKMRAEWQAKRAVTN